MTHRILRRVLFTVLALAGGFFMGAVLGGCSSAPVEVAHLDEMTQGEFDALVADITEPIPIALGIAIDHGKVDANDLVEVASVIEAIASAELKPTAGDPITQALKDAGFTNNEVLAVFYVVEKTLDRRGIKLGPIFGERTQALLHAIADAVTQATPSDSQSDG